MFCPDLSRLSLAPTGAGESAATPRSDAQILQEIEKLNIKQMQSLENMELRVDQLLSIMVTSPIKRKIAKTKLLELEKRMSLILKNDAARFTERDRIRRLLEDREWDEPIANHALVAAQIKHTLRVLKGLGAVPTVQGEALLEASKPHAPPSRWITDADDVSEPTVDDRVSPLMAVLEQKLADVTASWRIYANDRALDWEVQLVYGVGTASTPEELQKAFELWKELRKEEGSLTEELRLAYEDVAVEGVVPHVESAHVARDEALGKAFVELEEKMRALKMPFVQKSVDPAYDFDESIERFQTRLAMRRAQKRAKN